MVKIPVMYLFWYCNLKNIIPSDTVAYEEVKKLLGRRNAVPTILRKYVIKEMINFGLLKRISKQTIGVNNFSDETLRSWGIEIINIALEERERIKLHHLRYKQNF